MNTFKGLSKYDCLYIVDDVDNLLNLIKKYYDNVYLIDDYFIESNY